MTRLSWNSASEGTRVESVFSPWRQSENFYAVLRSKIALLKMEERRGSQEAEEHLRGERAESLRLRGVAGRLMQQRASLRTAVCGAEGRSETRAQGFKHLEVE